MIDPLSDYLGDTKMLNEQEVRAVLGPLKTLAETNMVAILVVMHLNTLIRPLALDPPEQI